MKFWITAGKGKLATDCQVYLKGQNIPFVAPHREVDLLDEEVVLRFLDAEEPTHLINCAAHLKIDLAETKEKELAYQVNGEIPFVLAKACKKRGVKLLHISTDYVFDGTMHHDYRENDICHPIQVYGKSKHQGETRMLEHYPEALSLRVASLYGSKDPHVVRHFISAMQENEVVPAILDQTSTPTYNLDVARALLDLRNEAGPLHFVNRGYASRYDLALEIQKLMEKYRIPSRVKEVKPISQKESSLLALRPVRSVLNAHKAAEKLSWEIPTWQEALEDYFRENVCS